MKAADLMTRDVATCGPDDSAAAAAKVMWDRDCGVVPVVEKGMLRGLVTDRDLLMAGQMQGKNPGEVRLSSLASRVPGPVATCREDEDVDSILTTMASKQVRRLPVVDRGGRLVGIVSLNDVALRSVGDEKRMLAVAQTLAAVGRHRQSSAPAGS